MKINEIQVNSFGNLQNKEIKLSEGINIIYGKNESGKSTLLKFISNIFYGISKNKRGKEISDYDRYTPWKSEEFSGKIKYELENGNKFEVYRDFRKKNPVILNEQYEDITNRFVVDKTNGNQFFYEQTKVNEETFLSSVVAEQKEIKVDKQTQNVLIQKLANFAGTGDDNISYKKAIEKLNKKQVEEIGTNRTQEKPINIVEKQIANFEFQKREANCFKDKIIQIEEQEKNIKENLQLQKEKIEIAKELRKINDKENYEIEKIKINENNIKNYEIEKIKLENEKNNLEKNKKEKQKEEEKINEKNILKIKNEKNRNLNKNKKIKIIGIIIFIILLILISINIFLIKNNILNIIFGILAIIDISSVLIFYLKNKNKIKNAEKEIIKITEESELEKKSILEEINQEIEKNNSQIEIYEKNIKEQKNNIEKIKQKINFEKNIEIEKINIENLEEEYQQTQIKYHKIKIEKDNIIPKLEEISYIEEQLQSLKEQKQNLLKDNRIIELAKDTLEQAYQEMKQNITPKFTQNLSETMQKISNDKYTKVRINEQEGIIVEREDGSYIGAERLSVGTIDQLYLSLRIAISREIANEKMPIILDEAFAYYDTERLSNILQYLNEEFAENQIIIFTCTKREEQILKEIGIKFNIITM